MTGTQEATTARWRKLNSLTWAWAILGSAPTYALSIAVLVGNATIPGDKTDFNRIYWAFIPAGLLIILTIVTVASFNKQKARLLRERELTHPEPVTSLS
jgi:hypothetical protein